MNWQDLKAGTRLELARLPDSTDEAASVSQLLAPVADSRSILVAMPIQGCRYVEWPAGTRLHVSLVESERGVWRFVARIGTAGAVGAGRQRIRTYTLLAESEPERCQRRAHFRVDCLLEANLYPDSETVPEAAGPEPSAALPAGTETSPPGALPGASMTALRAVTRNVSGGGASILADMPPSGTGRIELMLPTAGGSRPIVARCQVVRCESAWIDGQTKHRISLKFTEMSRSDEAALVRCLMRLQVRKKQQETGAGNGAGR